MFEITGQIHKIGAINQVTESFKKREFAIKVSKQIKDTEYTDFLKFQLIQDKVSLIDTLTKKDTVKVSFNIRGNELNDGRIFNNLDAWKVEKVEEEAPVPSNVGGGDEGNDLPF